MGPGEAGVSSPLRIFRSVFLLLLRVDIAMEDFPAAPLGGAFAADRIDALIAACRPGQALPRVFYTDPAIYQRDLDRVFRRHWHCLGHESILPEPGDFELFRLASEEVILTRDAEGRLHALLNICRHRGAQVCRAARGNARSFTCFYHGWTYGSDGALKAARLMPRDFDRAAHGLRRLALEVAEGLVFVSFAEHPLDFTQTAALIRATCGPYDWAGARVAHRQSYPLAANWKIAVENYVECYHCGPAHPEYSATHVLDAPPEEIEADNQAMEARTRAMGIVIPQDLDSWESSDTGREARRSYRYALRAGICSASDDGAAVAPLMGQFTGFDGGITSLQFGGTSFMAAYPDHGVIYRFVPTGIGTCEMELIWLVRGDAVEGRDYDLDRLTWLWRVTSDEDKAIIESAARGIASPFYRPGPIAPMEAAEQRIIDWYLAELSRP